MIGSFKEEGKALIILLNMISLCVLCLFLLFPVLGFLFQPTHWQTYTELHHFLLWPQASLSITDYQLTPQAEQHFYDVKHYVILLEVISIILTPLSCRLLYCDLIQGYCYTWTQRVSYWFKGELLLFAFIFILGFNQSFILFHRIIFRNSYWLFDHDRIIELFPPSFFMVLFIIGVIIFNGVLLFLYIIFKRKEC